MDDRTLKADKINSILHDIYKGDLSNCVCLDLGCSRGVISTQLARNFMIVIGIDKDYYAIRIAQGSKPTKSKSPYYISGDGGKLPFFDGKFDIVICAQVYEHVHDPAQMVSEIKRVLKPGGLCFFSGPNRLAVLEEHYWLPFLSYLPHTIASLYMRAMHRGTVYDIFPLTYWQLTQLWNGCEIHDFTLKLLRNPKRFSVNDRVEKYKLIKLLPDWLITSLRPFYPNYNWVIIKKNEYK
jgi:2-polyprenyl-3-methyl-5-hydroxy-6-metoxy-1,4-benzoquinol methylase